MCPRQKLTLGPSSDLMFLIRIESKNGLKFHFLSQFSSCPTSAHQLVWIWVRMNFERFNQLLLRVNSYSNLMVLCQNRC